ncbi:efflux RND transporter periplasmic adaptor subunit [Euhalothece natronophila Z-M001]|uniref:Efflux RND transporter periplasmic adaptor subunit n=2 Tax=Euhalothece TaxID=65097 RepID=A0A5B8NT55_9CHRO|nr:efflux RND transporter periplasmic adaptor subunit [Euhalothece natronophila Z-M001]
MLLTHSFPLIQRKPSSPLTTMILIGLLVPLLSSCGEFFSSTVDAQPEDREESKVSVESAIAQRKAIREPLTYKGDTAPQQTVALRSQAEGQLQELTVDTGDEIQQGQTLAQLNDVIFQGDIVEAEAELASRQSEVNRLRNQVRNAEVELEKAQAQAQQAQADAQRLQNLAEQGAISQQEAELATTDATVAQQEVRAAQEQIRIEEDAVASAQQQVRAQESIISQAQERRSYSTLRSPLNGVVLDRETDPGNLVQSGDEVLTLGDFENVKVRVLVSELALGDIQRGQQVEVTLDAFPEETYSGSVTRIAPSANDSRQVPVEVQVPNPDRRIGRGLLARVTFPRQDVERVVIPETALHDEEGNTATVFTLNRDQDPPTVEAQTVELGERVNDEVEIISGLEENMPYVLRSSGSLSSGDEVALSAISSSGDQSEED